MSFKKTEPTRRLYTKALLVFGGIDNKRCNGYTSKGAVYAKLFNRTISVLFKELVFF